MVLESPTQSFNRLKVRGLALAFLVISIGLGVILGIINPQLASPKNALFVPTVYILVMTLVCLWVLQRCHHTRIDLKRIVGQLPERVQWLRLVGLVLAIILFSIGSFLISFYGLSFIAPSFVEATLNDESLAVRTTAPALQNLLMFLSMIIVAPITEEFLFRGIIMHRWAEKWGIFSSLIVSSIVFGFLHPNVIGLSMFGLVMGLLYIKTRTLLVPIFCHTLNNLIAFGMTTLSSLNNANSFSTEKLHSDWWVGIVMVTISLPFLLQFILKNFPNQQTPMPYFQAGRQTRSRRT
jgi:membrane protease YdiL (CAAX protease family)